MPSPRASNPSSNDREHAIWEREMRRLGVVTRLLAAVLLALAVRILVFGATLTSGLTATVIAALTLASLLLIRYGHRHEPGSQRKTPRSRAEMRRRVKD